MNSTPSPTHTKKYSDVPHVTSKPRGAMSLCEQARAEGPGRPAARDAHCCHGLPWTPLSGSSSLPFSACSSRCTGPRSHTLPTLSPCASRAPRARLLRGSQGLRKVLPCSGHDENPDLGLSMPWSFSLRKFDQPFSKRVEPSLMQASFLYKAHCVFFAGFFFVFFK